MPLSGEKVVFGFAQSLGGSTHLYATKLDLD